MVDEMNIIDAENAVLGRLSTKIAKMLLAGMDVSVVNAEKAVISGEPSATAEKYKRRRLQKDKANPQHSPSWPRRPDMLVKRIIRGMLPYKYPRGRAAFKRLRVYQGVPPELSLSKALKLESKPKDELHTRSVTIENLCRLLGYDKR
jgi:large subunit ribosomal protein L13